MNRWLRALASWRLRLLFRSCFVLLATAVVALAINVLQDEKQRSYDSFQAGIGKTAAQIAARLRHPSGQLALLNPPRADGADLRSRPVVLPWSAIDFDDPAKVRHAVEMAGCLLQYPDGGSLCIALANTPWAGGYIYAAGTYTGPPLVAHRIGDDALGGAHRLRIAVSVRGIAEHWLAPFEIPVQDANGNQSLRGRFTGYVERDDDNYRGARPQRDFRGWAWQDGACVDGRDGVDCPRMKFFSVRVPVEPLRRALFDARKPVWPPPDLDRFRVHVQVLPPGDGAPLFDSDAAGAVPPFSLNDLAAQLQPGETLRIDAPGDKAGRIVLRGAGIDAGEPNSPLLMRLIDRLPVARYDKPVNIADVVSTPLGNFQVRLIGDPRGLDRALGVVATRLSWFVAAMLLALAVAWLIIEVGIIRRIARLTARSRELSRGVRDDALAHYDLADLRGNDELGILAGALDELLLRAKGDAARARIRAQQEKDLWHAVGHEIMSPLQSLLALYGSTDDPSHRYIQRMQQAVRVLYGSASPSEAFETSQLTVRPLDVALFLRHVTENAGIPGVACELPAEAVWAHADEYPLEDVMAHLLNNAERYRTPGTPITLSLAADDATVSISVCNAGPAIAHDDLERIFEYGVSDQPGAAAQGNRGQGLFVVRTYMAKMGGTVSVRNTADGVNFTLTLQRARATER